MLGTYLNYTFSLTPGQLPSQSVKKKKTELSILVDQVFIEMDLEIVHYSS